jgi:histidinol-phosphatase (PHP family)
MLGVKSLGFSGHCPLPFENKWTMQHVQIQDYLRDIEAARNKYSGEIEVYKSLEIDYIPAVISPSDQWIKDLELDYTIGSIHFTGTYADGSHGEVDGQHLRFLHALEHIYHHDIKAFLSDYFAMTRKMILEAQPTIIGHMDKIKMQNRGLWDESAPWYRQEILQTLEEIRSSGSIVEVNTRGLYKKLATETYPATWILAEIQKMGIAVQINSDAHIPVEITNRFSETLDLLYHLGFRKTKILSQNEWILADIEDGQLKW